MSYHRQFLTLWGNFCYGPHSVMEQVWGHKSVDLHFLFRSRPWVLNGPCVEGWPPKDMVSKRKPSKAKAVRNAGDPEMNEPLVLPSASSQVRVPIAPASTEPCLIHPRRPFQGPDFPLVLIPSMAPCGLQPRIWINSTKQSSLCFQWKSLSHIRLWPPWTIQSMEFSRPEYWYG